METQAASLPSSQKRTSFSSRDPAQPGERPGGGGSEAGDGCQDGQGCARQISEPRSSPASSHSALLQTHWPALSPVPDPVLPPGAAPPGPLGPSLMGQAHSQGLQARAACPSQFSARTRSTSTRCLKPQDTATLKMSLFPRALRSPRRRRSKRRADASAWRRRRLPGVLAEAAVGGAAVC